MLLYAYCSFSAVIGQIMVTWPPYKSDIGVQYHFPTLWLKSCQVHVLNSQLQLLKTKPTEVNWDKELGVGASCEIMIIKGINNTHF